MPEQQQQQQQLKADTGRMNFFINITKTGRALLDISAQQDTKHLQGLFACLGFFLEIKKESVHMSETLINCVHSVAYFFFSTWPCCFFFASWTDVQQVKMNPVLYESPPSPPSPSSQSKLVPYSDSRNFGESTC